MFDEGAQMDAPAAMLPVVNPKIYSCCPLDCSSVSWLAPC
jgi:hypothetical protein